MYNPYLLLLVVLSLRDGFAFFNGFQQLRVELGGFYDHLANGQDTANHLDGSNMLLDFYFHRGREPPFVLAPHAVIITLRAV